MARAIFPILVLGLVHHIVCSPGAFSGDDQQYRSPSNGGGNQQRSLTPESGHYSSRSSHNDERSQFQTVTSSSSYNDNEHPSENQYTTESSSSSAHKGWSDHSENGRNQYDSDTTQHTTPSNAAYGVQSQRSNSKSFGNEATPDSPTDTVNEDGLDGATSDTESYENSQSKEQATLAKINPEKALGGVVEFDGDNSDIDDFDFGIDELFAEDDVDVQANDILPSEWVIISSNYLEVLGKQRQTKKNKYKIQKATELKKLEEELVELNKKDFEDGDPKKLQSAKMEYDVLSHIHHLSVEDQKYVFDIDKDGIPDFEVVEVEEPIKKKQKKRKHKKRPKNKAQQQDQNRGENQSSGTDLNAESQSQNYGQQQNSYAQQTQNVDEFQNHNPAVNYDQQHETQQYTNNGEYESYKSNHHDEPVYDVQVKPYTYTGDKQSRTELQDGYSKQQKQQGEQYKR